MYLLGVYFQMDVVEVIIENTFFELRVHSVILGNFVLHASLPLSVLSAFVMLAGLFAKVDRTDWNGLADREEAQKIA